MPNKRKKTPSLKQQERIQYERWEASVKSQKTNFSRTPIPPQRNDLYYKLDTEGSRVTRTRSIPSLSTPGGSTAPPPDRVYSGTKMLGVSVLHKSNSVPVFDHESIQDIARMRR